MRKIIICLLLALVYTNLYSQQPNPDAPLTAADYLKKSEKQESTALVLLVGGLAVFGAGALLPGAEPDCDNPFCVLDDLTSEGIKATLQLAGGLSAIGSIPFFIESNKNRRKAAELTLSVQRTIPIDKRNLVHTAFPALGIKISF